MLQRDSSLSSHVSSINRSGWIGTAKVWESMIDACGGRVYPTPAGTETGFSASDASRRRRADHAATGNWRLDQEPGAATCRMHNNQSSGSTAALVRGLRTTVGSAGPDTRSGSRQTGGGRAPPLPSASGGPGDRPRGGISPRGPLRIERHRCTSTRTSRPRENEMLMLDAHGGVGRGRGRRRRLYTGIDTVRVSESG